MMGNLRESFVRQFLQSHLPAKFAWGSGVVVDAQQGHSSQQDIVVYRADIPKLNFGQYDLFLAEGVVATFEVKSTLSKNELTKALDSAQSVRQRQELPPSGDILAFGETLYRPLNYIFAYKGPTLDTTVKHLRQYSQDHNPVMTDLPFDAIVDLQHGALLPKDNGLIPGGDNTSFVMLPQADRALLLLFLHFVTTTQGLSFTEYDFGAYLKTPLLQIDGP